MAIRQGDIHWLDEWEPEGSEPGYRRPYLIVSGDSFNDSKIKTVVVCGLSTNPATARYPGNISLNAGEADLPKASVVNVTQFMTVNKSDLGEYIGSLPPLRIGQVLRGIGSMLGAETEADTEL